MADCLDRSESQALRGDDFFNMHSKGSKLIGTGSLCIATLRDTAICHDTLEDQSVKCSIVESITKSESLSGEDLILNESEICSMPGDNSVKHSHPPFRELVNDTSKNNVKSSVFLNDKSEVSSDVSSPLSKNDKHIGFTHHLFTSDDLNLKNKVAEKSNSKNTASFSDADTVDHSIISDREETNLITLNDSSITPSDSIASNCEVICSLSCNTKTNEELYSGKDKKSLLNDEINISINSSDLSPKEDMNGSNSDNYILMRQSSDNSEPELSDDIDEKSPERNFIEYASSELTNNIIEMDDNTLEIEIKEEEDAEEIPNEIVNKEEIIESDCIVEFLGDKEEIIDSHQITEEVADSDSSTALENFEEKSESNIEEGHMDMEDMEDIIEEVEVEMVEETSLDKDNLLTFNDDSQLVVEIVENQDEVLLNKDNTHMFPVTEDPDSRSLREDHSDSNKYEILTSKLDSALQSENALADSTDISNHSKSNVASTSKNDKKTEELICRNNENEANEKFECATQLVLLNQESKWNKKQVESERKLKKKFDDSIAGKLESLTGTVKIGCLSVTPLHPVINKNTSEKSDREKNDASEIETLVTTDKAENKNELTKIDQKIISENVSVFLKANEKLVNNNVEITISPKHSDYNSSSHNYLDNSLESVKVKRPQPTDSNTSKSLPFDTNQSEREKFKKNLIVNKNLKVIESFLMQKGFEREANILKEKTDLIKPYLEDIALKLERSINERAMSGGPSAQIRDSLISEPSKNTNDSSENGSKMELKNKNNVEKELAALTEKFLNSSVMNSKSARISHEDYMARFYNHMPSTYSNMADKHLYDQLYGRSPSYYDGADYFMKKDYPYYSSRGVEQKLSDNYRSSRHTLRDDCCNPFPDMFEQFPLEYDGNIYPAIPVPTSTTFKNNDFSLFIDAYTAEKYNNFIHFMVPDSEAVSYEVMESGKAENEINCVPMMDRGYPISPYWPMSANQYPMYPPPFMSTVPQQPPPLKPLYKPYPPLGHPLPVDSSKETCSQLTITPLDESGKPYGPRTISEPCGVPGCTEACSTSVPPPSVGMLPHLPPVQMGSFPHQLTITPLHQSSNLPYLHRSSSMRRRGRPPMDPDYGSVGYRKDAYANQRFSRSDFMARVRNNIDPYPDTRVFDTSRINKMYTDVENKDTHSQIEAVPSSKSASVHTPTSVPQIPSPVAPSPISITKSSTIQQPTIPPSIPSSVSPKSSDVKTLNTPSITTSAESSVEKSPPKSNGFKNSDSSDTTKNEKNKELKKYISVIPKLNPVDILPTSSPQKICSKKSFNIHSKQIKILPNSLISGDKSRSIERNSLPSENLSKTVPNSISSNTISNKNSNKSQPEKLISLKKITSNLENVLNNKNITLKTVRTLTPISSKKENLSKDEHKILPAKKVSTTVKTNSLFSSENIINKKELDIKANLKELKVNEFKSNILSSDPVKIQSDSKFSPLVSSGSISKLPIQSKLNHIEKNTPSVKSKRRKKCLTIQKKKKNNIPILSKNHVESMSKITPKAPKAASTPVPFKSKGESFSSPDDSTLSKDNSSTAKALSNLMKEKEVIEADNSDSMDKSADGIRRSGRKRKIIEGNPKFRDMERVDLKYFREERLKPTPTKRKLESKVSKLEASLKKRILNNSKLSVNKQSKIINIEQMKPFSEPPRMIEKKPEEMKTQEKLQQFLDVNDIYLKPQTFV